MDRVQLPPRKRNRGARRTTIFTEASVRRLALPQQGEQVDYFEKLKRGLTLQLRLSYFPAQN